MGHVGSYSGYWDVGTLHMGSEEGIVFLLKSRIKMGEESDVSILFHFGTSGCIQVKEWGKKKYYSHPPSTQRMEFVPFPVLISCLLSQFLPAGPDTTVRTG